MSISDIETVLLDVGGVIYKDAIEPKMRDLAMKYSIPIALLRNEKPSLRRSVDLGIISEAVFWQKLIEAGGVNCKEDDLDLDRYLLEIPGATAALELLAKRYRIALLTNDSVHLALARRSRVPIEITHAFVSAELGLIKPDPEIFRHALRGIGSPANTCAFIDDTEENVVAANGLGMIGIRFRSWGETLVQLGYSGADLASY